MMYVLVFHVPKTDAERVKDAVFSAGAGRMGNYERCCFQVPGVGQFTPMAMAHPAIGSVGQKTIVDEMRIEMTVDESCVKQVIQALLDTHPYEVPSYHLIAVTTLEQIGCD
jgi:hypothetical protein